MRKFSRLKYIFFLLFFTLFLIPAVDCSFISGGTETSSKLTPFGNANAVAYIGSTNYVTIESALRNAKSGDKVYVYPGTNPIINQSCVVKNGVELYIPYESETWENRESSGTANFADSTTSYVNTYRKNEVKINSGVSLTIEDGGSLYIGGQTGNTGQPMQGHTCGKYTQITLYDNAQIINKGNVKCFGYIKEQSKDNNSKFLSYSGEVYSPLVVYDYRGGTSTAGVYKSSDTGAPISPFNVLDMPNIQVYSAYYHGTNLFGYVNLYTGQASMSAAGATVTIKSRYNYEEIKVISSNTEVGIFELSSGGYITTKFNTYFDNNNNCLTKNTLTTKLDLYNNATFNVMSLSINAANDVTVDPPILEIVAKPIIQGLLNTTITTKDVYFPVSYKMDITLHEGNFKSEGKLKFLPGSKITINNGANLTLNDTFFYTDFIDTSYGSYVYPTSIDEVALERAKIIVNGNLTLVNKNDGLVNSGSGGIIDTSEDNAILSVLTTNLTATSYDGHGTRDGTTFNFIPNSNSPKVENLRGVMNTTNTNDDGTSNFSYGFYASKNQKWVSIDESELGSYTLNFNANGGNYTGESSVQIKYLLSNSNPKIESINVPNPTKDYYEFVGWYIEGTDTLALNYPISDGGVYNLVAHYVIDEYTVSYVIQYDTNLTPGTLINDNPTTITYENINSSLKLLEPIDGEYNFYGWFTNAEMTEFVDAFTASLLTSAQSTNNTITLYGLFTQKDIYDIEIYDADNNLYQSKKIIAESEYVDVYLPSDILIDESYIEGTCFESSILYKHEYNYKGWTVTNGIFESGLNTVGKVSSAKVKRITEDVIIIRPDFDHLITPYYKLSISINCRRLSGTSGSVSITGGIIQDFDYAINNSYTIDDNTDDIYISADSLVTVHYKGRGGFLSNNVRVDFKGFLNVKNIDTTEEGQVTTQIDQNAFSGNASINIYTG